MAQQTDNPSSGNNRIVIIFLAIALVATWGYIIWDKNRARNEKNKTDLIISTTSGERDELKRQLDEASSRYDELKTASSAKDSIITSRDVEIREKKDRIENLLSRANAGRKELAEAKALIESLNTDIDRYKEQIQELEGKNIQLTREKETVTGERDQLVKQYDSAKLEISGRDMVIDVGSTLHASSFNIEALFEKRSGKEVNTEKARKADKLRISFDLDENMIAPSGAKQLFIIITDPSGKPILNTESGSGRFVARDGKDLSYTQRVDVNYVQNQRQTVNFEWKQGGTFVTGNYRIEVYHNGFKLGEGLRPLR